MQKILFLLVLLLPVSSFSIEEKQKTLLDLLPPAFSEIYRAKKYDKKPDKINEQGIKLFVRDGFKYALSIGEKNGVVSEIYFTCTQSTNCPSYHELKNSTPHTKLILSKREGGENGHFLETTIPEKNLTLIFKNICKIIKSSRMIWIL